MMGKCGLLVVVFGCCSTLAIANADNVSLPNPVPWQLPTYDGNTDMQPPPDQHNLPDRPDADHLYELAIQCYPAPSLWQPEVALKTGYTKAVNDGDVVSLDTAKGLYVQVVASMPLYSSVELQRDREREYLRREKVAAAVSEFEGAVAKRANARREIALYKAIEARAAKRVAIGVAPTSEQITALTRVAALQTDISEAGSKISKARLSLLGMCRDSATVLAYLDAWAR